MNLNTKDLHLKISSPHKKGKYTKKCIPSYYEQAALGNDQSWKVLREMTWTFLIPICSQCKGSTWTRICSSSATAFPVLPVGLTENGSGLFGYIRLVAVAPEDLEAQDLSSWRGDNLLSCVKVGSLSLSCGW